MKNKVVVLNMLQPYSMRGKIMNKRIKNILWFLFVIIDIILIGIFAYKIFSSAKEYNEISEMDLQVQEEFVEEKNKENDKESNKERKIDWNKLKNTNEDIVAWIKIPNTNIDYPIVQGNDNLEYISKNLYGRKSKAGCLFVDSNTISPFESNNTIIYGHNLNNGSMFSNIKKYKNKNYAKNHKEIDILLPDGRKLKYEVFAFYKINANNYDIYDTDVENLAEYYSTIQKYNNLEMNYDLSKAILTLSTCTNGNKNNRYILQAYLTEKVN